MTILPFPVPADASAFDPSAVRIIGDAFEEAWHYLQSTGTTFHTDGHDQRRLRDAALAHLAEANVRRGRD